MGIRFQRYLELTKTQVAAKFPDGVKLPLGFVVFVTDAAESEVKRYDGEGITVDATTSLEYAGVGASGASGTRKVQITAVNTALDEDANGLRSHFHIESGGSVATVDTTHITLPSAGRVKSFDVTNFTGADTTITFSVGAGQFQGVVDSQGDPTDNAIVIADRTTIRVFVDSDGFVQSTISFNVASQAEVDGINTILGLKLDKAEAPIAPDWQANIPVKVNELRRAPTTGTGFNGVTQLIVDRDLMRSLSARTTGAAFDNTEADNWEPLARTNSAFAGVYPGLMSSLSQSKLNAIEPNANNYAHPDHTGDVTSTGDGATVIADGVVSNTKLTNMAANTIKGNNTGAAGVPVDLTVLQAKTLMALENVDNTTDLNKPVSTAQQAALNDKQDLGYDPNEVNENRVVHLRPENISDSAGATQGTWLNDGTGADFSQGTETIKPLQAVGVNGFNALDFVSDDYLDSSDANVFTSAFSMFVVADTDSLTSYQRLVSEVSASSGALAFGKNTAGYLTIGRPNVGESQQVKDLLMTLNATQIIGFQSAVGKDGGAITCDLFLDGVQGTSQSLTGLPTQTAIRVGASGAGSEGWDGKISELIIIPANLSVSARQAIEGYLAHKYALLAQLAASHPYKTVAPSALDVQRILATPGVIGTSGLVDDAVTNAKLADMTANSFKGNATASSADPTDITFAANQFPARASTGNLAAKAITDAGLQFLALASAEGQVVYGLANGYETSTQFIWDAANNNLGVNFALPSSTLHVGGTGRFSGNVTIDTLTAGSVLFAGPSGVLAQDNAQLFWDDTNNRLGVKTEVPEQAVHVVGNILNEGEGATCINECRCFGSAFPRYVMKRAGGTKAAPTALSANNTIGSVTAEAHDGTSFKEIAAQRFRAKGNQTATNRGSYQIWEVTPENSTVLAERMRLDSIGLGIGTNAPNDAAAAFQIDSTTQGALPAPKMTGAQALAIVSPPVGLQVEITDGTPGLYRFDSVNFIQIA